jgi:hypothetical protein
MEPGDPVRGNERRFDAATLRLFPDGTVRLEGRILSQNENGEFERCLHRFHEQVIKREARRVIVDLAELDWISESAVTALVSWVLRIQREPPDKRYRVMFRINASVPWQRGTFGALVTVARGVVEIDRQ